MNPVDMKKWNDIIFTEICKVNRNLYNGELPRKAHDRLSCLENCLCSGDGLTKESAFRAEDWSTVKKVLSLLGVSVSPSEQMTGLGMSKVSLNDNPFGIGYLYFCLQA